MKRIGILILAGILLFPVQDTNACILGLGKLVNFLRGEKSPQVEEPIADPASSKDTSSASDTSSGFDAPAEVDSSTPGADEERTTEGKGVE